MMRDTPYHSIIRLLQCANVPYESSEHEPVYTSEQAATMRNAPLSSGAKALICKTDAGFVMLVLPADRRISSKRAREAIGSKNLRFATRDEVFTITSLLPGAIPPFGSLFALQTWCDTNLSENVMINFNAGDHTRSVQMRYEDYIRIEQPILASLSDA